MTLHQSLFLHFQLSLCTLSRVDEIERQVLLKQHNLSIVLVGVIMHNISFSNNQIITLAKSLESDLHLQNPYICSHLPLACLSELGYNEETHCLIIKSVCRLLRGGYSLDMM